jgi:hypothetical protein
MNKRMMLPYARSASGGFGCGGCGEVGGVEGGGGSSACGGGELELGDEAGAEVVEDHFDIEVSFPFFAREWGWGAGCGVFWGKRGGEGGIGFRDGEGLGLECGLENWGLEPLRGGEEGGVRGFGDGWEAGIGEGSGCGLEVGGECAWMVCELVDENAEFAGYPFEEPVFPGGLVVLLILRNETVTRIKRRCGLWCRG